MKQKESEKKWKGDKSVAEGAGRELRDLLNQAGESTDKRN